MWCFLNLINFVTVINFKYRKERAKKWEKRKGQKGKKRGEEMLFNIFGLILGTNITYLNVFILTIIVFLSYFSIIIFFLLLFIWKNFFHLLVGDRSMNIVYLRFFLCVLENFSIFCRFISTFLRMFCNLLASHFLMLLFCDFIVFLVIIVFALCAIWFSSIVLVFFLFFLFFLFALELFCSLLQIYIFCNMIFQLWLDFLLFFVIN